MPKTATKMIRKLGHLQYEERLQWRSGLEAPSLLAAKEEHPYEKGQWVHCHIAKQPPPAHPPFPGEPKCDFM